MAGQPKKSFNVYQNTLKAGLTAMKKYSDTSRRGFLVIVQDNTGLQKFGTKNLVEQFQRTKSCEVCCGWEDAAKVDTKELNSENSDDVIDVAAKASTSNHILADVYMGGDVPRLPFDVDIMSEKEAADWILPELKKDLVENGAQKEMKIMWKQWLKGYTEEINEIICNNPRGLHIKCDDCNKNVAKQSYLRHRTVNGCASINPKIKFYNWCS